MKQKVKIMELKDMLITLMQVKAMLLTNQATQANIISILKKQTLK